MFEMLQNLFLTTVMSCQTHLLGIGYNTVFNRMYSVTKLQAEVLGHLKFFYVTCVRKEKADIYFRILSYCRYFLLCVTSM